MHKQIRFIAQNIEHTVQSVLSRLNLGKREHAASYKFHKARMKGEG